MLSLSEVRTEKWFPTQVWNMWSTRRSQVLEGSMVNNGRWRTTTGRYNDGSGDTYLGDEKGKRGLMTEVAKDIFLWLFSIRFWNAPTVVAAVMFGLFGL
jgi:hypothetical protein